MSTLLLDVTWPVAASLHERQILLLRSLYSVPSRYSKRRLKEISPISSKTSYPTDTLQQLRAVEDTTYVKGAVKIFYYYV